LTSELCQTVGDEFFFFTLHSFLEVGKTQDLPSKFWQTLGDALKEDISRYQVRLEFPRTNHLTACSFGWWLMVGAGLF
jgi:hypothetical protein